MKLFVSYITNALFPVPENLPASDQFRMVACYVTASVFILVETIGTATMFLTYDTFGMGHIYHIIGLVVPFVALLSLRFYRNFLVHGLIAALVPVLIVVSSGISNNTGIYENGAPFIPIGILICGVISGWRTCLAAGCIAIAAFSSLGIYSVLYVEPITALIRHGSHTAEVLTRTFYFVVTCVITMTVMARLTKYMHKLFHDMEESLDVAQKAEQSKSAFLANMSHELRTPLNGVVGMSGLLLKTNLDSQQHQYAKIVNDCSQGLVTIINDVLDISKIDAGMFELRLEVFSIREMATHVVDLHQSNAVNRGLALNLQVSADIPEQVEGDKGRITQVLNNLVSNAIKFTSQGSVSLFIRGKYDDKGVFDAEFYVRDTGVGLDAEACENVFKRFHQVDSSLNRSQDGTGLGLSICQEFIERMEGELKVVSEVGKGSTFYFILPLPVAITQKQAEDVPAISASKRLAS